MLRKTHELIKGWGNYPVKNCEVFEPESKAELQEFLKSNRQLIKTCIPRGSGRSYGDSSIAPHAVSLAKFNKILAFDEGLSLIHI